MANTVDKVIAIAEAEVGYLEKSKATYLKDKTVLDRKTDGAGYDNYTKYGRDMHEIYPSVMDFPASWCDALVDWCFYKAYGVANAKGLLCGNFDDYTVASAQLYKNKNAWHTSNPKVGDQIFFKNAERICHTGLVYKVDSKYVYTIEGNTSAGSEVVPNGGGVFKKKYPLTNTRIAGYGRPKYDSPESISSLSSTPSDNLITYPIKTGQKRLTVCVDGYLNVRNFPSTGDIITKLYNGDIVTPEKKTFIDGKAWFWIKECNGWCSASYLSGWVEESDGRWWYLDYGYQWKTGINEIDGSWYYFDKDGWLVTDNRIDIDNNTYFTRTDGSFFTNTWIDHDSKWYYVGNDGKVYKKRFFYDLEKEELYYLTDDGTMFEGEIIFHTNDKGALSVG